MSPLAAKMEGPGLVLHALGCGFAEEGLPEGESLRFRCREPSRRREPEVAIYRAGGAGRV